MNHSKRKLFILMNVICLLLGFSIVSAQDGLPETELVAIASGLDNQLTLEDLQNLNNGQAEVYIHNGRVTFVDGTCVEGLVNSIEDAAEAVVSMIELLGGDERVAFEPWRTLNDPYGNTYYVFRQMYAGMTVLNGAVKVIVDADGNMIALSSSIETDLPDTESSEGITAEEAEQIVLKHAEEADQGELTILSEFTDEIILPTVTAIDIDTDDSDASARFVWMVYTDNPANRNGKSAELPYLAHYVEMDGTYLYSLATIIPGDPVGAMGFDTEYVFEFMEPVEYTGYVDLSDGTEKELTVTVMRDKRTGMYYLGNIERKIVVADCWEFLYNGGNLKLAYSPDNLEWDQVGLLSFYNYCRAYDYYKEIGWIGADGLERPILILNDYCDINHIPVNNAAFVGHYMGWSLFVASQGNDLSQCLDVIAHEFTHAVIGSVMTYNAYLNDYGAINEGMSDIQGEICEQMFDDVAENRLWIIGNNSLEPVRSMSHPHDGSQPEYSWDLYYQANVNQPTAVNDYGGVHSNSSLLNLVAYHLIHDGGMSLEEGRGFWFAVDCTMVPGTDYAQLAELLPFVLKAVGMDQYETTLRHALDATRMGINEIPDFFDDDRALVTLTLPDNENFTDDNWALQIFSVDLNLVIEKGTEIVQMVMSGDYSELPETLQAILDSSKEPVAEAPEETTEIAEADPESVSFLEELLAGLMSGSMEGSEESSVEPTAEEQNAEEALGFTDDLKTEIITWLKKEFIDAYYSAMGTAGQDGLTVAMVTRPGRTIPFLIHMRFDENSTEPDQVVYAMYMMGKWYTLDGLADYGEETEPVEETSEDTDVLGELMESPIVSDLTEQLGSIFTDFNGIDSILDIFTYQIEGGEVNVIGSDGLETIVLPEPIDRSEIETAPVDPAPGRMSRPKQDN